MKEGTRIRAADQLGLLIVKYLPHARQDIAFLPVRASDNDANAAESAVLVKVDAGGDPQKVWLKRADPDSGLRSGFQEMSTRKARSPSCMATRGGRWASR